MDKEAQPISIQLQGTTYTGWYSVQDGFVSVSTAKGTKFLKHDVVPAEVVAQLLLRDLIHEGAF